MPSFWPLFILALLSLLHVEQAHSQVWNRAKSLVSGQRVWTFSSSYQKVSSHFGSDGNVQPLGQNYSRPITWGQLLTSEANVSARANIQNYMNERGLSSRDVAAQAKYDVEREYTGFGIGWAYGMTPGWMFGFQVPLVRKQTTIRSQIVPSGADQDTALIRASAKAASAELSSVGYDEAPERQDEWAWGDASLMNKISLFRGQDVNWALSQEVRFPSSRNPDSADYFAEQTGESQVGLGLSSLTDFQIRRWTLGLRLGYLAQSSGDIAWGASSLDFQFSRRLLIDVEYSYFAKTEGKYQDKEQESHQSKLGLLYTFEGASARRGIEDKWMASVAYAQPWLGRNSANAGKATVELISYF